MTSLDARCVTDYIRFCEENFIPTRKVSLLPQQQTVDQQEHQAPVKKEEGFHGFHWQKINS